MAFATLTSLGEAQFGFAVGDKKHASSGRQHEPGNPESHASDDLQRVSGGGPLCCGSTIRPRASQSRSAAWRCRWDAEAFCGGECIGCATVVLCLFFFGTQRTQWVR